MGAEKRLPWTLRLRPPFHIGQIVIVHEGCWASDLTKAFPNIRLYLFVTGCGAQAYEVYAVIKPKDPKEFMDAEFRDRIMAFINEHPLVENGISLIQYEKEIIAQVRILDLSGPVGVIRVIRFFGAIMTEIGCLVEDGKEYVNGLFPNEEVFNACIKMMKDIYGKKSVLDVECQFAKKSGLTLDPPLFEETALCNTVKFDQQRKAIDHFLKTGDIDAVASEKSPQEILNKITDLLRKTEPYFPLIKDVVAWVLKIMFPQLPDSPHS